MNFKTLVTLSALAMFVFGLPMLLIPETFFGLLLTTVPPEAAAIGRLYGAVVIAWGVLDLLVRNSHKSEARDGVAMGKFAAWTIAFLVALWVQLSGIFSSLGWALVAVELLYALAFAYLVFMKQEEPDSVTS